MTITRGFPSNSESSDRNQRLPNPYPVLIPDDTDCCKVLAPDVVCGGRPLFAHHPGNRRFRNVIATKKEAYQTATTKDDRASIVEEAMRTVRESGGRFMRRKNGRLTEMEDGLARELVQKAFECVPRAIPKIPERTQAILTREVSEENTPSDDESRFRTILTDQRKIFEALMKKQGMHLP